MYPLIGELLHLLLTTKYSWHWWGVQHVEKRQNNVRVMQSLNSKQILHEEQKSSNWRASCKKLVSDFLGWNFFSHPNELNFGMWPSTSQKNIPPYLSLLVSLSFSINNGCKNAVFFLAVSFPKKAFVFPNNRISEARICCQCWFKKISWKRKTKQQKKLRGNVFPLSPRSHAKIELIWMRTKICPKKSLTSFLHEALQL